MESICAKVAALLWFHGMYNSMFAYLWCCIWLFMVIDKSPNLHTETSKTHGIRNAVFINLHHANYKHDKG